MFGFFRSKKPANDSSPAGIATEALRVMGFKLTPYGIGMVVASGMSGYSPHETASMVALMTFAWDIRESRNDVAIMMKVAVHGVEVIKILHQFKEQGLLKEDIWENDVNAIKNIINPSSQTKEWVAKVLDGDPIAGKERLAKRTVAV